MFTRLSIPTPFRVGAVNAYLSGRTVVDPGPDSEEAWAALLDGLEANGMTPADLRQVVVTHPHPDHFGLASRLKAEGASVVASPEAARIMADFPGRLQHEQTFFADFFERNGMSAATANAVVDLPESYLSYAPSVETDTEVTEDDRIEINGEPLVAKRVTGHAIGELIFAFDEGNERHAIVGDNVLNEITPNPLLQPPEPGEDERPRPLPAFNESLRRLEEAEYDRFLPGHRTIIENLTERIGEMLDAHEARTEKVYGLVDGPTTAVEIMGELFGDLPVTEFFPGMSEAVGHLDVLESRGKVAAHENGGVIVYERT
ncbi:MBL fold metallo-hydrolase [Haladaptatus sp. DYSN1]|uniref:MBL fold metallo-hydrolase n=1 Tax=unclassified Haladaptatus TaxID=2622732 RepID=UPI0024067AA1|nr:MBL fold metallo-hydrolase [Haladaptatus sp. DYSN1]